ncbi:hypothetical protein SLEP1_g39740 [Rubroshorea leprosula]|uniref:Uncharacterized protein n=1 Tax=Rubroshorea leprosula TaxID=152421 RepID=A0AAV5L181_9ROSI|nr:hypothetical protein SLEP1_g39740 [Rubroshorea leprosula]
MVVLLSFIPAKDSLLVKAWPRSPSTLLYLNYCMTFLFLLLSQLVSSWTLELYNNDTNIMMLIKPLSHSLEIKVILYN